MIKLFAVLSAACATTTAFAQTSNEQPERTRVDVSANLTVASDYVFRGVSQTEGNPAAFGTISATFGHFYAGASVENVKFPGVTVEYDAWVGYKFEQPATRLDVGVIFYGYIDSPDAIDTFELKAVAERDIGPATVVLTGYYAPDYFGSSQDAFYKEVGVRLGVSDSLTLSAAGGHQQISGGANYTTANVGLTQALALNFTADLRYHWAEKDVFGHNAGSRVVASLSYTIP